mgnify:FL=1
MSLPKLIFSTIAIALILTLSPSQTQAKGDLGMTAAVGLPNGFTPSVGAPSTLISRITIQLGASSSFNIMLSDAFQLDLGIGYLSITPEKGDAANTFSLGAGGKYFLDKGDVRPYINAGLSFTQIPTVKSGTVETSGNLITFLAAFGAQAFINSSNSVALFVQMGFGYNTGTLKSDMTIPGAGTTSSSTSYSSINLGGSAIGATVYF